MKKVRKFEEGGYTGDDEIVKYRMGMIDAKGNDLTKSKKDVYENNAPYKSDDQGLNLTKEMVAAERVSRGYEDAPVTKTVTKATVKATPKPKDIKKADVITDINEMPESLRAPNYKVSDRVRLPNKPNIKPDLAKKMAENKSTSNTKLASGGKVSSASSRADGCAVRGKTRA
jgi:hypothetical protein